MEKTKNNEQFIFEDDNQEQIVTPHLPTIEGDVEAAENPSKSVKANSYLKQLQGYDIPNQEKLNYQTKQQQNLTLEKPGNLVFLEENAFSFRDPNMLKSPSHQLDKNQQSEVNLFADTTTEKQEVANSNFNKMSGNLKGSRNSKSRFNDVSDSEVISNNKLAGVVSHLHDANRMTPGMFVRHLEEEENHKTEDPLSNEKYNPLYSAQLKPHKASRSKLPPLQNIKNGQILINNSSVEVMGNQSSMVVLDHKQNININHSLQLSLAKNMVIPLTCLSPQNIMSCIFLRKRSCCTHSVFQLVRKDMSFIACAKKEFCHFNSYYNITAEERSFEPSSKNFIGYLKGNFSGTEFNLYQMYDGIQELACTICYKAELTCSPTFRNSEVYIRNVDIPYDQLQGIDKGLSNLQELYEIGENAPLRKIVKLVSKKPEWSQEHDCYLLDFRGRSKMGSVKNMILTEEHQPQIYSMLFCKTGVDCFHLEITYPLSPFIAVGILLSSFDFKLFCQ